MTTAQRTTVRCPQCQQPVAVNLYNIVDVGQQPQLKQALLRGQINAISCSRCGYRGMVAMPLLYHDPTKELALVMMPMELGMKRSDEERTIGRLSNALMDGTPAEKRRMYMLQPKTVLSFQRLTEEILQADGITKEMIDKQASQLRLLETILQGAASEQEFKRSIEEHKEELNQEFIDTVVALARSTAAGGDRQGGTQLLQIASALAAELGLKAPDSMAMSADELISALRKARSDSELKGLVAAIRPALDYRFYQALTGKIESAGKEEAQELKSLRERLLSLSDEVDRETEAALHNASALLQEILQSDDPHRALADKLSRVDEAFMLVLQANIQQAKEQHQDEVAKVLNDLYQAAVAQIEAELPAEQRLINLLLRSSPGERAEIMRERGDEITPQLIEKMKAMAGDLAAQGSLDVADELRMVMNQAAAWARPVAAGKA